MDLIEVDQSYLPKQGVKEHEVFLSFNSDMDALCFREWLAEEWEQFLLFKRDWSY